MSPADEELLIAANAALADPNFRASVKQMHAEGYPLVQMVGALGLDDDMSARIRQILESLPDDVVAGIRTATLAMLDRGTYALPVICTVPAADLANVRLTIDPEGVRILVVDDEDYITDLVAVGPALRRLRGRHRGRRSRGARQDRDDPPRPRRPRHRHARHRRDRGRRAAPP